jgi:hypothetical protein
MKGVWGEWKSRNIEKYASAVGAHAGQDYVYTVPSMVCPGMSCDRRSVRGGSRGGCHSELLPMVRYFGQQAMPYIYFILTQNTIFCIFF